MVEKKNQKKLKQKDHQKPTNQVYSITKNAILLNSKILENV